MRQCLPAVPWLKQTRFTWPSHRRALQEILADPEDTTPEDDFVQEELHAQLDLLLKIRDKLTQAHDAIVRLHHCRRDDIGTGIEHELGEPLDRIVHVVAGSRTRPIAVPTESSGLIQKGPW